MAMLTGSLTTREIEVSHSSTSRVAISEGGEALQVRVDVAEGHVDHGEALEIMADAVSVAPSRSAPLTGLSRGFGEASRAG
jgi:hypothetical protein